MISFQNLDLVTRNKMKNKELKINYLMVPRKQRYDSQALNSHWFSLNSKLSTCIKQFIQLFKRIKLEKKKQQYGFRQQLQLTEIMNYQISWWKIGIEVTQHYNNL